MRKVTVAFIFLIVSASFSFGNAVVFWEDGFPTVSSQAVPRTVLEKALDGLAPVFVGTDGLSDPATLAGADLLVLPYGSAMPVAAWGSILGYVRGGGNLLIVGGQPLRVPVTKTDGKFVLAMPQDTYSRELGFRHTYEASRVDNVTFAWKLGYSFLGGSEVHARRTFVVEGDLNGLGYLVDANGVEIAAPVIVADHRDRTVPGNDMLGSRVVMLDFEPEPGYWESSDGTALLRQAANYARQGATGFWVETLFAALNPGERPQIVIHLSSTRRERLGLPENGQVKLELLSGDTALETANVSTSGAKVDASIELRQPLGPGFYRVHAVYENDGQPRESYQSGFWVEDEKLLSSGPTLEAKGDFLARDGKPYFPVGTNYFTTEDQDWDFSGPRNAWIWEKDFAEMEKHGVTFVRTGVWMPFMRFVERTTGEVNERFLRNLEAFLLCARRHNIVVDFTFFAFSPRFGHDPAATIPNPYIDPASVRGEQDYVLSVVNRFKNVPWLCWDLINEPSFSNPRRLWKGNSPNGDPAELMAWHQWLRKNYSTMAELAAAWSVTPEELGSFDSVPLPGTDDLAFDRYGNTKHVRAFDYNLFAQDMFTQWVRSMVTAIRGTGSKQLINVGQDEGGVADRVLNQFYASGGVSFTTNHTYWRDDALLWDSVVAKRPGLPNIVGETGYQPVWDANGTWRYDELTGRDLLERKWALGFAVANSGAVQWDWAREPDFGMKRSDGSAKTWQFMMRDVGHFAESASSWATGMAQPQVAIVLPQSLQLSVMNNQALEAQQKSVKALYQYARAEGYAVGEYQVELLGNPKLIILPSPLTLAPKAWEAILGKVREGATLLVSGRFDEDAHFHSTGRQNDLGLDYGPGLLTLRENELRWPGGELRLTYGGDKTTYLDRAILPANVGWAEKSLGKGRVIFVALPLELNDNLQAIGDVYRYALKVAGVVPTYSTTLQDPGILICPTQFPKATLYVLTSESDQREVSFRDLRSGKQITGKLDPGRAALLLIGNDGKVLAAYNWTGR